MNDDDFLEWLWASINNPLRLPAEVIAAYRGPCLVVDNPTGNPNVINPQLRLVVDNTPSDEGVFPSDQEFCPEPPEAA